MPAPSTLAAARTAYLANASYAEDKSPPEAQAFLSACRALLLLLPAESGDRGGHMRLNPELVQKEMDEARKWLEGNDPATPKATFTSFWGFRGE